MEQKYDMIKFKIAKVDEQGNVLEKNYTPLFEEKSGEEAFDILYKADVMTEVAWGYLYKRDFFRRNKNEITKSIDEELDEIENYTEQALFYARSNTANKDYVVTKSNLQEIVNGAILKNKSALLSSKTSIELHDLEREVYTDSKWAVFIINQIIQNAIKYSKIKDRKIEIYAISKRENVVLYIKDNGIGMSEEFIKNELFTPFVQADNSPRSDYNGTGLGMPIVKQLVEKMGGTITVESKLGEGSCFSVILPFEIDTNARPEEKEDFNADLSGVRILLAEDNELNAEIAEFMLTENGAKVETVKNGLEAVQHFEACESGTYDVILMDVMMPVMDGLTATKTIRSLERQDAKTIPIIAMTANAFREDAEKCMEAGMNAHLSKPIVIEEVIKTILRYVHND